MPSNWSGPTAMSWQPWPVLVVKEIQGEGTIKSMEAINLIAGFFICFGLPLIVLVAVVWVHVGMSRSEKAAMARDYQTYLRERRRVEAYRRINRRRR